MSANVRYAKDLSGNGYHGTYIDVTTQSGTGVSASTKRAALNGTTSRFQTGLDSSLDLANSNSFVFVMVFRRTSFTSKDDDYIAERLVTQYASTYEERVAVGINENKLCLLYRKTDDTKVVVKGSLDVTAGVDHHLLVRVSATENRITVMLDGKIEHDVTVPSLANPGITNSYIGGDGNRRLFSGQIDQPAFVSVHDLDKSLEYFNRVAFDGPLDFVFWAGFDPANSSTVATISSDKRTATVNDAGYRTVKLQKPMPNTVESAVEFELSSLLADTTVVGMCLVNASVEEDLAIGDKFQSLGLNYDGVVKYKDSFGATTEYNTGQTLVAGDFIRFQFDGSINTFHIYVNDYLAHSIQVQAGVAWYPAVSMRNDTVRVNSGWRNFRHPTPIAGIAYASFTEAESACLYSRLMPTTDSSSANQVTMLFLEEALSLYLKDAFTDAVIGDYHLNVSRLNPSITSNPNDKSVKLNGGTIKVSPGVITQRYLDISAHLAFRLEYEDYFEDKILFHMDKGGSGWWRFFIRAGELCFEDSSDGGTPELITTGYIFPVRQTCTAAFSIVGQHDIYFYCGGVLAASDLAGTINIANVVGNGLYIGSEPDGTNGLTSYFSHAMYMGGATDNAAYREWKFRKVNQKVGGQGLVDFSTYLFPLENVTQELYDLVTITFPGMAGWSA